VGRSGSIVKMRMLETAPPGLDTVTAADSARFDGLADTAAVNCVALTKVVARGEPFHSTVAPGTNLDPLTVKVNAGTPSIAALGLRVVKVAAGGLTVSGAGLETAPFRLTSVMAAMPATSNRLDGTNAVTCVVLTSVVANDNPFQYTTTPGA
jgi:hypothetical protein